jgi:predicted transcriptional regulator
MTDGERLRGLRLRLGPLEIAVLVQLWDTGPLDVAAAHRLVCLERERSRNTIQSTLERLVRKRLAVRTRRGRAYEYCATISREDWTAAAVQELIAEIPGADERLLLAAFVERADPTTLDALEELVRERRLARRGGR